MRPLELRLSGFRSYRTERTVPFREMDIVAIIGDTGAGKSSLLEAMTWALYGASTWSRKSSSDLLAHGAKRMTVALEFEASGERWVVTRSFARTGGGSAELVCASSPTTHPKVDGVRQVDPVIEGLVGLPYDVFCSCVLLPQGKFERLLKATKGEKTDTLKSILRLEPLGEIRERADGLVRRVADRERDMLVARGRFQPDPLGGAEAAAERLAGLAPEGERWHALQAEVLRLAETCRGHVERAAALTGDADRLAERRGARAEQLRALAELAAALEAALVAERSAHRAAATEREAAEHAQRQAAAAGLDELSLTTAAAGLREARGLFARRTETAQRIAADERELATVPLAPAHARQQSAEGALAALDDSRVRAAAHASSARERAHHLADGAERVAAAVASHTAAGSTAATAREAASASRRVHAGAQDALAVALATRDGAVAALDAARRTHAAAHVASGCAPGDPCPVCARTLPDSFALHRAPDLDAAEAAVAAASARFEQADASERTAAHGAARDEERAVTAQASLTSAATALAAALTAAASAAELYAPRPGQAARAAAAALADSPAAAELLAGAAGSADAEAIQAEADLAALDAGRPGLERERTEAAQALASVQERKNATERALGERREEHARLARALAAAFSGEPTQAAFDAADARMSTQLAAAQALATRLDRTRRAEAAALRVVHDRELQIAREVTAPVAELRAGLEGLAAELPAPEPAPAGIEALVRFADAVEARVDERIAALRAEAQSAREAEARDRAAGEQALSAAGFSGPAALTERLDRVRGEIVAAERERDAAQAQIAPVQRLEALISRATSLRAGLEALKDALADRAFVGFVVTRRQRALLQHASRVLEEITGRYAFTEDFQILDRESGLPRSPDTLSGGETFIASLALALGLVEVADRSGGDLRALFLDEGFGTLDATILDTALTALEERAKAGRLIGLISHVPTVAERIDTVLEVRTGLEGSSVHLLDRNEREERVLGALTAELS